MDNGCVLYHQRIDFPRSNARLQFYLLSAATQNLDMFSDGLLEKSYSIFV
jgi:hypothetical protein